jgi:hypothetical protein
MPQVTCLSVRRATFLSVAYSQQSHKTYYGKWPPEIEVMVAAELLQGLADADSIGIFGIKRSEVEGAGDGAPADRVPGLRCVSSGCVEC